MQRYKYTREIHDYILDTDDWRFANYVVDGWRLVTVVCVPSDKYTNSFTFHYYWEKQF